MKTWKSKLLVGALALAASPLLATPQGAPAEQSTPANPPGSSHTQPLAQPGENQPGRRHHRQRHHRRHRRRHAAMMLRNPAFRERLGITSEQAARIEAQQNAFQKAMIRGRAEAQVKRLELQRVAGRREAGPCLDRAEAQPTE